MAWRFAAVFCLIVQLVPVRGQHVQGVPVLGFVLDESLHRLRPIVGISGAASLGPAFPSDVDLNVVAVSPKQDYVLALLGDTREAHILMAKDAFNATRIEGVLPGADRIVLSPDGSAAVLYSESTAQAQIVSGLPDHPSTSWNMDLSTLPARPGVMAVNDSGSVLLVAQMPSEPASTDDPPPVAVFSLAGNLTYVKLGGPVTAIAFVSGRTDAILAGGSQVVLIGDIAGQANAMDLTGGDTRVSGTIAVAATPDARKVFVASRDTSKVVIFSTGGEAPTTASCPCDLSGLFRLKGTSLYRVTPYTGDPLWMLDVSGANPRVVFVSPARDAGREP